jgi:hypothetical protein
MTEFQETPPASTRWMGASFAEWVAVMQADDDDATHDDGFWLAGMVQQQLESGGDTGTNPYPVERWIEEAPPATRALAIESLTVWARGVPATDPDDEGWVPTTDEEWIEQYEAEQPPGPGPDEDGNLPLFRDGSYAMVPRVVERAEAIVVLNQYRAACRAAIEMIKSAAS